MVMRQNRWSSYSVTVMPGQCRYTAPTSNSSKYRPNCTGSLLVALGRDVASTSGDTAGSLGSTLDHRSSRVNASMTLHRPEEVRKPR
jgi:hypothetical protein